MEISKHAEDLIIKFGNSSYWIEEMNEDNAHKVKGQLDNCDKSQKDLEDYIASLEAQLASLQAHIAELEAAQRWIPVSERLPEVGKVVVVIDMSDKDSHLCNVYETAILVEVRGDTRFGFIGHSGWDSSDVTHWMPLPKLPEAQE